MPKRRGLRYTVAERNFLDVHSLGVATWEEMEVTARVLARVLNRTECAIQKQIQIRLRWFWASKKK